MNKVTQAKENTIIGQEKEQIALAMTSLFTDKTTGFAEEIDKDNLENVLNNNGNNVKVDYEENDCLSVTFKNTTHEYIIDGHKRITLKGSKIVEGDVPSSPAQPVVISSIKSWTSNSEADFHKESIRNIIKEIEFVDYIPNPVILNENNCWDVSQGEDQSIIAWLEDIENSEYKKLYIGGNGGVKANEDSSYIFYSFQNLTNISFGNNYDTSDAINMSWMFANSIKLEKLDLRSFNTSKVTDMSAMFLGAAESNETDTNWLGQTKMALKEIDVSSFDTKNVITMYSMFGNCGNLTILDVSNFDTRNVTTMCGMFNMPNDLSTKLETIILGDKWDTSKVTTMLYMFCECCALKKIYVCNEFDTSSVENSYKMFGSCSNKLTGGNGTKWTSNQMDKTYAKIDKLGQRGYFTDKSQELLENNTQLEYIKSTGTQFIDTDFPLWKNNNWKMELKFDISEFYNYNNMFGLLDIENTDNESWIASDKTYYVRIGGILKTSIAVLDLNTPYTIVHDNTGENLLNYVNGKLVKTLAKANTNSNYTLGFGHRQGSKYLKGKIYYLKFWSEGKTVRDFIPVHNTITNSAGLYDKVEGRFYPNNGTEMFTEGQRVNN